MAGPICSGVYHSGGSFLGITKHGLLEQLEQQSGFTRAEERLVDFVKRSPHSVLNLAARELAMKAGVSEATVVRTCQRLGYSGYPQFKLSLAFELSSQSEGSPSPMEGDIDATDDLQTIVNKVFHARIDAMTRSLQHLNLQNFTKAVDALAAANHIVALASGSQGHLVDRLCARISLTGLRCTGWKDPAQQLAAAAIIDPTDILLVFTHSGRWRTHTKAIQMAKQRGATTIAVTNFGQSPVGRAVDIPVITHGGDMVFFSESMGSELVQAVLMDCIIIGIANERREIVMPNLVTTRSTLEENLRE